MSDERYRCSFDGVADVYERSRPGYAPDAVTWLSQRLPLGRVLDLGAGTGKLTRQLVPYALEVVAVEPGDEMRRVLQEVVPGVEALFGTAEAIPLPDESVDAVTVAQAFHWFEPEQALAEMHRVLRPGGGVALLWNEWDEEDELLRAVDAVIDRLRPQFDRDRQEELLETTPLFTDRDRRRFHHVEAIDEKTMIERVMSISAIAAADRRARDEALAEIGELLPGGEIAFPMITFVGVADRA